MALALQHSFQTTTADQIARWISDTPREELNELGRKVAERSQAGLPMTRSLVDQWVRDCTRNIGKDKRTGKKRNDTRADARKPPQVGAKDHKTLARRLDYQGRGLHLPYARMAAYNQQIPANEWTRVSLKPHDDPYELATGNGLVLNQDGLWTFMLKTDWGIGFAEVILEAAQATRLMVNGTDVGLRDFLDDDAYSAKIPINTFAWSDVLRAGTTIHVDVRSEGLGKGYTATANVYLRAYLVRCFDGEFDMPYFPPPPPPPKPKPDPIPNPPMGGYTPTVPTQPAQPKEPDKCGNINYYPNVVISEGGQLGSYKCINGETTIVWSSYGWDGGIHFGGGTVGGPGSPVGPPGPYPSSSTAGSGTRPAYSTSGW